MALGEGGIVTKAQITLDAHGPNGTPVVYAVEVSESRTDWSNAKLHGLYTSQARAQEEAEKVRMARRSWVRGYRFATASRVYGVES